MNIRLHLSPSALLAVILLALTTCQPQHARQPESCKETAQ